MRIRGPLPSALNKNRRDGGYTERVTECWSYPVYSEFFFFVPRVTTPIRIEYPEQLVGSPDQFNIKIRYTHNWSFLLNNN